MDKLLEDTDLVDARFDQAGAIIDLLQFAAVRSDAVISLEVVAHACDAADTLLKQGRQAFRRIDQARIKARPKAR